MSNAKTGAKKRMKEKCQMYIEKPIFAIIHKKDISLSSEIIYTDTLYVAIPSTTLQNSCVQGDVK